MAMTFGAGSDGPLLMQQQPADPNRAMLAQILANAQNAPPPRTGNAAMFQTLAQVLAGGGNALMAGRERAEQEEAGNIISGLITGKPPEPEKPGLLQRAADAIGLGGDKPEAAPAPAASPRANQFAQLIAGAGTDGGPRDGPVPPAVAAGIRQYGPQLARFDGQEGGGTPQVAEGGQPDQTPAVGMPSVTSPDSGAATPGPASAGAPAAPRAPLSAREQLTQALASSNPRVRAWAMNRALAIQDAETKRDAELDKELATKGLRRVANADGTFSVAPITGYGPGRGQVQADEFTAQSSAYLARRQGEADQDLQNKPVLAARTIEAETPPKVAQVTALSPAEAAAAGAKTTATERAALPFVGPKADAQAAGAATGSARVALAPAPAAPGVTPGGTIHQALAEAAAKGTQIATGPGETPKKEQALRQEFDQIPAVKTYRETVKDFSAIQDASTRNTKASDLNMVYGLAHIMDPNSVVREGEQIAVKNTQGIPDWLLGRINEINGGAGLTPAGRVDIVREARSRLDATKGVHDQFEGVYKRLATDAGLKHENVVVPIVAPSSPQPEARPSQGHVTVPVAAPGLVVPPQRGAQAAPAPQFSPEQVQAEIARRGLKAQ